MGGEAYRKVILGDCQRFTLRIAGSSVTNRLYSLFSFVFHDIRSSWPQKRVQTVIARNGRKIILPDQILKKIAELSRRGDHIRDRVVICVIPRADTLAADHDLHTMSLPCVLFYIVPQSRRRGNNVLSKHHRNRQIPEVGMDTPPPFKISPSREEKNLALTGRLW